MTWVDQVEKLFTEREEALRALERAEAVWELSKKKTGDGAEGEGERPMHKTGWMGLFGPKVDSIDYWRAKSEELAPQVQAEQKRTRQDLEQDAAFVIFNDRRSATEASQVLIRPETIMVIVLSE